MSTNDPTPDGEQENGTSGTADSTGAGMGAGDVPIVPPLPPYTPPGYTPPGAASPASPPPAQPLPGAFDSGYGSDGRVFPGPYSGRPAVDDNRPGVWWGVVAGIALVLVCVVWTSATAQWSFASGVWFVGMTTSFAVLPVAGIALVIPERTRKIGQGILIVLGMMPFVWFGVCVQAMIG